MRTWTITLFVFLLTAAAACGAENSKDAIAKRLAERHQALQQHKNAGRAGETNRGFVEAVGRQDDGLAELLAAENRDRRALYAIIAREQSTAEQPVSADQVGRQNAILKFKKAAPGEYFKGRDGQWRTKGEMLEAAQNQ